MSDLGDLSSAAGDLAKTAERLADHYTKPKPVTIWSRFDGFKVPLTTVFVTTLLSVWLVPSISERAATVKRGGGIRRFF